MNHYGIEMLITVFVEKWSLHMNYTWGTMKNHSVTQVQAPRVGTAPNQAVQHGPIALLKNMCSAYGTYRTYFASAQWAS
jgi:hypothetical protein